MKKKSVVSGLPVMSILALIVATAYAAIVGSKKEGLVEYVGAQKDVFVTGKAASVVSLDGLSGQKGLYAVGPIDGFGGEITVFDSKPYITKVSGNDYVAENTWKHGAFFLVWTEQAKWQDTPIPATVKGYVDLQKFVKTRLRRRASIRPSPSRSCSRGRRLISSGTSTWTGRTGSLLRRSYLPSRSSTSRQRTSR